MPTSRTGALRAALLVSGAVGSLVVAQSARAQTSPSNQPFETTDVNGVDLGTRSITKTLGNLALAPNTPNELRISIQQSTPSMEVTSSLDTAISTALDFSTNTFSLIVSFQDGQDVFDQDPSNPWVYNAAKRNGATLTMNQANATVVYTSGNGTTILFDQLYNGHDQNQ